MLGFKQSTSQENLGHKHSTTDATTSQLHSENPVSILQIVIAPEGNLTNVLISPRISSLHNFQFLSMKPQKLTGYTVFCHKLMHLLKEVYIIGFETK